MIASNISTITVTQTVIQSGGIFLNKDEIDFIKSKVSANQEPWKSTYNKLMNEYVPAAMSMPIQTVVNNGPAPPNGNQHDYYTGNSQFGSDYSRTDYFNAQKMSKSVRHLGLAYALTGNTSYADKAIQFINGWCIDSATYMIPRYPYWNDGNFSSAMELANTMPAVYYGADLIWNYSGWNASKKDAFKTWVSTLVNETKWGDPCISNTGCNNWSHWALLIKSAGAALTNNTTKLTEAFNEWKRIIPFGIDNDGSFRQERIRGEGGLFYSTFRTIPMLGVAEIARHRPELGFDLYHYKLTDGTNRGLEKVLDFHAPYIINPSSWPYTKGSFDEPGRLSNNAAIYEIANKVYPKAIYRNVINYWKRPMYEDRILGPTTLTHCIV